MTDVDPGRATTRSSKAERFNYPPPDYAMDALAELTRRALEGDEARAEVERLREGYCSEAYIVMVQALDVKALGKGRRRIMALQARRMARVGLGQGPPRSAGGAGDARRLAQDVLDRVAEEEAA